MPLIGQPPTEDLSAVVADRIFKGVGAEIDLCEEIAEFLVKEGMVTADTLWPISPAKSQLEGKKK